LPVAFFADGRALPLPDIFLRGRAGRGRGRRARERARGAREEKRREKLLLTI
jgi:hypothetical protein